MISSYPLEFLSFSKSIILFISLLFVYTYASITYWNHINSATCSVLKHIQTALKLMVWIAPGCTGVSYLTWRSILIPLAYIDAPSKMCGPLLLFTVYVENLHITIATNHTASQDTDCTLCKLHVITAFIMASHWTVSSATEIKSTFLGCISLYFIASLEIFWIKYCRLFSNFHLNIYALPISFPPSNNWWGAKNNEVSQY